MKHLNLILIILILSCCPLHPAYAFFDKDIRLLKGSKQKTCQHCTCFNN